MKRQISCISSLFFLYYKFRVIHILRTTYIHKHGFCLETSVAAQHCRRNWMSSLQRDIGPEAKLPHHWVISSQTAQASKILYLPVHRKSKPSPYVMHRAGNSLFFSRFAFRSIFIHGSLSLYHSFCWFSGLLIPQSLSKRPVCSAHVVPNVYDDISGENRVAFPNQIFHPDCMFV